MLDGRVLGASQVEYKPFAENSASVLLCSGALTDSPPGFPASNLASNAKEMGKIKLFPTTEYPVVPLVPCTGIFLGRQNRAKPWL